MVARLEVERAPARRGGAPRRASSSVNPSGALSCGRFGVFASSSVSAASAASSSGSFALSSAETLLTSSISRCFSSPGAPPIAFDAWFCSARSASTLPSARGGARRRRAARRRRRRGSGGPGLCGTVRGLADRLEVEHLRHLHLLRASRSWTRRPGCAGCACDAGLSRPRPLAPASMMLCPWKMPPSSTTRVFDVMLPSTRPPRASSRLALHGDVALEPAGHGDVLRADVGLDLALRREDDVAVGVDLALHLPVDPQATRRRRRSLELRTVADDRDLTVSAICLSSLLCERASDPRPVGAAPLLELGLVGLVLLEDHRASTAWTGAAMSAWRIASSSSDGEVVGARPRP